MDIIFDPPREIVAVPQQTKLVDKLTVTQIVDWSEIKTVTASVKELGTITLWQGDAYDQIGQWTDADVQNRILELYP